MASRSKLHPVVAAVKRNLPRVARELGFSAKVTSGLRSYAKQAKLYEAYLNGFQQYPVAPPGTSKHELGLALDIVTDNLPYLIQILAEVGMKWAGFQDAIHFELVTEEPQKAPQEAVGAPQSDFWDWLSIFLLPNALYAEKVDPQKEIDKLGLGNSGSW